MLTLPLSSQLKLTVSPIKPNAAHGCVPNVLKLSFTVSDVFPKVLQLSSEVSECKPLGAGGVGTGGSGAAPGDRAVHARDVQEHPEHAAPAPVGRCRLTLSNSC